MNLLIIIVFAILIYFLVFKASHTKQKVTWLIIILFILFLYISYTEVTKEFSLNYNSIDGIEKGVQLYFSWLGNAFNNIKGLSGNAVNMDWSLHQNNTANSSGG